VIECLRRLSIHVKAQGKEIATKARFLLAINIGMENSKRIRKSRHQLEPQSTEAVRPLDSL